MLGADDPRSRAALDDSRRIVRDRAGIEDTAARLHHHQPAADAGVADLGDNGLHVMPDRRADICVDDRGGGALIFELLGQHIHGERNEGARKHLAQDLAGPPLMGGIGVGVQIADRDRRDACSANPLRRRAHIGFVEGAERLSARPRPLVDLEPELSRHKRRRALVERLIQVRHPHPPELQHIAKSAGGEQRRRRALAFENRIGRDGAAMQQFLEAARRGFDLFEQAAHAGDDRIRIVARGGGEFAGGEASIGSEDGDVGESAPDVGGGAGNDRRLGHVQQDRTDAPPIGADVGAANRETARYNPPEACRRRQGMKRGIGT